MQFVSFLPVVCWILFSAGRISARSADEKCKPRLFVISYDAFRPEYLTRNITPNAVELQKYGVHAQRLHNVFPTKTLTNHFSMATGVFPETHGVIANSLYDPVLGPLVHGSELFQYNREIMPIWTLNELSGGRSGCMMWPGSDFDYHNITCTHNMTYNTNITFKDRVDKIIDWMTDKERPINLAVMYVEQPDKTGHQIGPDDPKINKIIKQVDWITGYIQEQLKMHELAKCTDVIHVSDHGMISISSAGVLDFSPFLVNGTYKTYGSSPVLQVVPANDSLISDIYDRLLNASKQLGHFNVYKQPDLPERWHVRTSRFGPIVVVADLGYAFQDFFDTMKYYEKTYNVTASPTANYGIHGYDNEYHEMSGYFMAKGPSFKQGVTIDEFDVIDLYNLFVKVLDLPNAPLTNGSYKRAMALLNDEEAKTVPVTGIVVAIVLILLTIVVVIAFIIYRRRRSYFMWW